MNPYIEFAQWLITSWREWYAAHGTKLLGSLFTAFNSMATYLAFISSSPDFDLLVTPKQFALIGLVNAALGGAIVKRGFTNTKAASP